MDETKDPRSSQEPTDSQDVIPFPADGFLLTFAEAGSYLRLSAASVRKLVDGRPDQKDDELGSRIRNWVVRLSPHRRYVKRGPFMAWLRELSEGSRSQAG